jgi:hypothetical protein
MFKDNSVFVVGAGASSEFGLPVGYELMNTIRQNTAYQMEAGRFISGARTIAAYYEKIYRTDTEALRRRIDTSRQISRGITSADSIDEYIYRYSEDPLVAEVGKLHIAHAISKAESSSILSFQNGFGDDISSADNTWLWPFAKALMNGIRASELKRIGSNITIICFNYDRCIEHYLMHALKASFEGLSLDSAGEIVSEINIIHPYGSLGDLNRITFGDASKFAGMAENLITWSETISDEDMIREIRKAIRSAQQLVFLGFGFANQNMELLSAQPTERAYWGPAVYSTGLGLPIEVHPSLAQKIMSLYSKGVVDSPFMKIHFQYGAECKAFMDLHRLNLVK